MAAKDKAMKELVKLVQQWSIDRGLDIADSRGQFLKVVEEVGEVAAALCRSDMDALKDGIGDVVVTLIIYAQQNDLHNFEDFINEPAFYGYDHDATFAAMITREISDLYFLHLDQTGDMRISKLKNCISVLRGLAKCNDMNLAECLQAAYDEISGRTGEMVNGVYVKTEDLPKPEYDQETWLTESGSVAGYKNDS